MYNNKRYDENKLLIYDAISHDIPAQLLALHLEGQSKHVVKF